MRTILAASLLVLLAAVACGSEAPEPVAATEPTATTESMATVAATSTPTDTAQDPDRAALLKEFAQRGGDAMAKREWAIVHTLYPDEFRAKCSLGEFAAMTAFVVAFAGIPEDITYVFESARVEGNHGYIDSHFAKDGLEIDLGGEEETDPHALWQDGKWTFYVSPEDLAEENPCSLEFTTPEPTAAPSPTRTPGPTATPTATPTPRPPGYSLNNPVEAGGILQGSDGTEISVLKIIADARQQIAEENRFNDPPEEGNRFYMIRVDIVYPSGDESISVREADFKLIGDNRLVYAPFDQTCGVIPDELDGEIFGGGRIEGNICFEIPEDEGGLILIHEPGFGSESRRFLSLEE